MGAQANEVRLDAAGIDQLSEDVAAFLEKTKLDRRGALSARLSFESCLLALQKHFGDGIPATVWVGNKLGRPRFQVRVEGERFDPRTAEDESDWERSLLENAGLTPSYAYRGGHNIISLSHPFPEIGSTLISFLAICLGVAISFAGNALSPEMRTMLLNELVNPVVDTFVGLLASIAGPMVFFSVAWGICGIGDMQALGRSGKTFIGRFMGVNAASTILALAVCVPVLHVQGGVNAEGMLGSIVELLLGLLPTNFLQPFLEGNTLQIIVLAVVIGVAALALGEVSAGIRTALHALNTLVQFLMEQLCRLLPGFIVFMMVSQAWSGTAKDLLSSWLPILLAAGTILCFLMLVIVITSIRHRLSIAKVFLACVPASFLAFTTASPSATFGTMLSTCREQFGVDEDQTGFGVPLGMVLCKPASPILLVTIMLYCVQTYGGGGSGAVWFIRLAVTCLLYAVAVPPVPGGMLACYGMLFAALGVPVQAMGVATALDLLIDNGVACTNVVTLILQVFGAADGMGAVDGERLAKLRR